MKSYRVLSIFLIFAIIVSCNIGKAENDVVSGNHKSKKDIKERISDSATVLYLGTFNNFIDVLNSVYDNKGGIHAVVDWTSKNLKKNSKIKFLTTDIDGAKKDMIITVSYILIEKLDSQGKETGKYYLGNPNQIDDKNSDMIFSYRDNFRNDKYNLVIYKKKD